MIGKLKSLTAENWFFLAVTLLNLIPALGCSFFPTMDGAAHLYNSTIINELIFKNNTQLAEFFTLNRIPVPNWTGHFILSVFNLFFPAVVAEKVLVLFYLIGLPYAFRYLISTISPKTVLLSYFIFPFTYSFLFLLGFYNFSLALVFLFFALGYWIKIQRKDFTAARVFIVFLLMLVTFFSHVFIFASLLFLLTAYTLFTGVFQNLNEGRSVISGLFTKLKTLLFASIIPVLLFCWYFFSMQSEASSVSFVNARELVEWLKDIRPIIAYNQDVEEPYTKKIAYAILTLLIIVFYDRINAVKSTTEPSSLKSKVITTVKTLFHLHDFWLLASCLFLVLYFKLPDTGANAGYISIRLGLLFFLLLIIWLSAQRIPKWLSVVSIAVVLYCNFSLNNYYNSSIKELNKQALSCNEAGNHIVSNSIVLPLNYSDNWLAGHFSNYMGIDKPMIILENYECGTNYFPVLWNEDSMPNVMMGNVGSAQFPCLQWKSNSHGKTVLIDYVFVLGDMESKTDSCTQQAVRSIKEQYTLVFSNEHCKLFEKKKL